MSNRNPVENDHKLGVSAVADTVGGMAENNFIVAATLAAIVLAGSALLYSGRMRAAHSDFVHAVPGPEHAATRLVDQGGPDSRTSQGNVLVRGRIDGRSSGDSASVSDDTATSSSVAARAAEDTDALKEKASRSKDRRRRGKDPLKEVLKSGKKSKSFIVQTAPSPTALDANTPTKPSPRSTGVQTESEFQSPSPSALLGSDPASVVPQTSSSDQRPSSPRTAGKRPQRERTFSSVTNSARSSSSSTSTSASTPTPASTSLLRRALSPNPSYDLAHGDPVRSSSRASITISEDDATHSSSGMTSAAHSRTTSEVFQNGDTESLGFSASKQLEGGDGQGRKNILESGTWPNAICEKFVGGRNAKANLQESPYVDEGDAMGRPKHFHHPRPPEEEEMGSDNDEEDMHSRSRTTDRVRRLSESGYRSLPVSNSRSHSHSPSPLRQSHTLSCSHEQCRPQASPRTGTRASSSSIGSEEVGDEEDKGRSDVGEGDVEYEDGRVPTGHTAVTRTGIRLLGLSLQEGSDMSGELADRGRKTSRRGDVKVEREGEDQDAIGRMVFGSVQTNGSHQEGSRSIEGDQQLEVTSGPPGLIVVEPQVSDSGPFQGGAMDAGVEEVSSSALSSFFPATETAATPAIESARDTHSDSSNMATGPGHSEQSMRAKKRAKKAAASGQATTVQDSVLTPRKVPPGSSGWDWDGAGSSTSTSSTPAAEKSKTSKDRPASGVSPATFSAALGTGLASTSNHAGGRANTQQQKREMVNKQNVHSEVEVSAPNPAGSTRRPPHLADSTNSAVTARSTKKNHRPTTPSALSRAKSGTPPPLTPHRPNSPGDAGMFGVSEQTQLASLRGALEAARQREEKHKAEMERVMKEMENLKWESVGLRKGEGELQAHIQHLTGRVQGYESFFANIAPSAHLFVPHPLQQQTSHSIPNSQPQLQTTGQDHHHIEAKALMLEAEDQSPTNSSAELMNGETELSAGHQEENQNDFDTASSPSKAEDTSPPLIDDSPESRDAHHPQKAEEQPSTQPMRLPFLPPSLPPISTPMAGGAPSALPAFPSPMSPSFFPYHIPPPHFSPHGHPNHPMMAQQLHWMQSPWAATHNFNAQGGPQSPSQQTMFSPTLVPIPPYTPPLQSGSFQNAAIPLPNGGFANPSSPGHLSYSFHSPRPANDAGAPSSAPGSSSAGSMSPELSASPLAMDGKIHRSTINRMRSTVNNLDSSRHGDSDGDVDEIGGTSAFSGMLADAILRRPGSIHVASSSSPRKIIHEKEGGSLPRQGSGESVEQMTEFTFPSISDMTASYRNSPRTESSISSSLSSSPPSSTATIPDPVADPMLEGEKANLTPQVKVEDNDSIMSTKQRSEFNVYSTSPNATPRKEEHLTKVLDTTDFQAS